MMAARAFAKSSVHGPGDTSAMVNLAEAAPKVKAPCHCEADSRSWKKAHRPKGSKPRCMFFTLGANDGDTYTYFRENSRKGKAKGLANYEEVKKTNFYHRPQPSSLDAVKSAVTSFFPSIFGKPDRFYFSIGPDHEHGSECEAFMVEANPSFKNNLTNIAKQVNEHSFAWVDRNPLTGTAEQVKVFGPNTAYMCEGTSTFYLDPQMAHSWEAIASSMSAVANTGGFTKVSVPTVNLIRLLYENVMPDDFAIIDMDIEGAEFDILPCLARSPAAELVDELYMEVHDINWSLLHTTTKDMTDAVDTLRKKGVIFADYAWGIKY